MNGKANRAAVVLTVVVALVASTARADDYKVKQNKQDQYRVGVKYLPSIVTGQETRARIWVVAADGWKVNDKYPIQVTVSAPAGIDLPVDTFKKGDAASFDQHKAVFKVGYEARTAGEHQMQAKVKMSVCKGTQECIVRTENLSWKVTASGGSGG